MSIRKQYGGTIMVDEVIRFLCFWDGSLSNDSINRKYIKLVKAEAKRRGESPEAFAKALEEVE